MYHYALKQPHLCLSIEPVFRNTMSPPTLFATLNSDLMNKIDGADVEGVDADPKPKNGNAAVRDAADDDMDDPEDGLNWLIEQR